MESDWANLPALTLSLILDKLEERIDHVWFSVVCKNWCSVANLNHQSHEFRSKVLPVLMIPTISKSEKENRLYGIATNRIYPFGLPEKGSGFFGGITRNEFKSFKSLDYDKRCGSSHGWLATVDHYNMITLQNPFKNVPPICLPPTFNSDCVRDYKVSKVILSADPITSPNDYVVAIIHGSRYNVAFIRVDEYWTYIDEEISMITDIIFYQGLLYAVGRWSNCVSFNLNGPETIIQTTFVSFEAQFRSRRSYIVNSLEGDLWIVRRLASNFISDEPADSTDKFEVYKLKLDSHGKLLEKIKLESLGDNVLFLGYNDSMSVSASSFSGCLQKDSIYFSNDFDNFYFSSFYDAPLPYPNEPFNFGIYCVKDKSFSAHCPYHSSYKGTPPPLWILPSFQWD